MSYAFSLSLSVFSFMDYTFGIVSKIWLPNPRPPRFFPMLSSRIFIVLCFTFSSMVKFGLIFVKDVKSVSTFIYFAYRCPIFPAPFVEKTILCSLNCLCSIIKNHFCIFVWMYFWTLTCSIYLFVYYFANTTLSWLL